MLDDNRLICPLHGRIPGDKGPCPHCEIRGGAIGHLIGSKLTQSNGKGDGKVTSVSKYPDISLKITFEHLSTLYKKPVTTQEVFNWYMQNPIIIQVDKKRMMLFSIFVALEDHKFFWSAMCRIYFTKKNVMKARDTWMPKEIDKVKLKLDEALENFTTESLWSDQPYAEMLQKPLRTQELIVLEEYNPEIKESRIEDNRD